MPFMVERSSGQSMTKETQILILLWQVLPGTGQSITNCFLRTTGSALAWDQPQVQERGPAQVGLQPAPAALCSQHWRADCPWPFCCCWDERGVQWVVSADWLTKLTYWRQHYPVGEQLCLKDFKRSGWWTTEHGKLWRFWDSKQKKWAYFMSKTKTKQNGKKKKKQLILVVAQGSAPEFNQSPPRWMHLLTGGLSWELNHRREDHYYLL